MMKAEQSGIPVSVVSAVSEGADNVTVLDVGTDSYVTKPFSPRELFFFSSRRRHTSFDCDWSSDVCSSDLEIHFRIGRMKRPAMHAAARRSADDHRNRSVPQVVRFGDEVRYLIEAAGDEVDELHFRDGPQAKETHSTGRADDGCFADGSFNHAFTAKFSEEALGDFECAAVNADIFADGDDGRVACHFFEHGLADGFHHSDWSSGRGRLRCHVQRLPCLSGAFFANDLP